MCEGGTANLKNHGAEVGYIGQTSQKMQLCCNIFYNTLNMLFRMRNVLSYKVIQTVASCPRTPLQSCNYG